MNSIELNFVRCEHSHWNTRIQNGDSIRFCSFAVNKPLVADDMQYEVRIKTASHVRLDRRSRRNTEAGPHTFGQNKIKTISPFLPAGGYASAVHVFYGHVAYPSVRHEPVSYRNG